MGLGHDVPPSGSGHCYLLFPIEEAFEVEGDVGEADLCPGPFDPDGADEQTHSVFLGGKDMLDGGADFGTGGIGFLTLRRKRLARRPAEVDLDRRPARAIFLSFFWLR